MSSTLAIRGSVAVCDSRGSGHTAASLTTGDDPRVVRTADSCSCEVVVTCASATDAAPAASPLCTRTRSQPCDVTERHSASNVFHGAQLVPIPRQAAGRTAHTHQRSWRPPCHLLWQRPGQSVGHLHEAANNSGGCKYVMFDSGPTCKLPAAHRSSIHVRDAQTPSKTESVGAPGGCEQSLG